ncbi:MAG: protein phosphatase CheZ [Burkholderiaceae bacterium]|jgi:chemotaxis protein CheZ
MSSSATVDNDDLEALFDSIAEQRQAPAPVLAPEAASAVPSGACAGVGPVGEGPIHGPEELFDRVGRLTRCLHDALAELGYDKAMAKVVGALPDARDRLTYISTLTQDAAERALEAVESAMPLQEEIASAARSLSEKWDAVFEGKLEVSEFRGLALATRSLLKELPERTDQTQKKLLDIMMAQDFHDLTGQVIKKIVDLAHMVETELVDVLIAAHPEDRHAHEELVLNGPVIRAEGRTDVVTNQAQVDELLGQLGF